MSKLPEFVEFRYSEPEWDQIKSVVPDALRRKFNLNRRRGMEIAVSAYLPRSGMNRQRPSRDELERLREDAENLRARIVDALAFHVIVKRPPWWGGVGTIMEFPHTVPQHGVDRDMLNATSDYFTKLAHTLNRQIEKTETRTRRDSARKTERDAYWNDLLLMWCGLGGKPTGMDAAKFLSAASKPVGAGASIKTILKWLKVAEPVKRRRAIR